MKLILIRGLPGSGKSTFARHIQSANDQIFEADHFHMIGDEYVYEKKNASYAHDYCRSMAAYHLKQGLGDVIVANTFTSYKEMYPYAKMSADFNATLEIYRMVSAFDTIHKVPPEIYDAMQARMMDNQLENEKPVAVIKGEYVISGKSGDIFFEIMYRYLDQQNNAYMK